MIKANKYTVFIAGISALVLTMGVGRYAFTPMIPYMEAQMDMSESLAGWLAGWAYIGYLTGLFIVWLIRDLKLKDYFYRYGLFLAVFSTAIMGMHEHALVWYLSRFFAGIATALGFMLGTGLVLKWLLHHNHETEMGLHFAGIGLGIILGAIVVDVAAKEALLNLSWRGQWFALAGFGLLVALPAMFLLPLPAEEQLVESKNIDKTNEPSTKWLVLLSIAYICAGFSNTVNVTFTSLMAEYVPLIGKGTLMWMFVGLAAAPAPFVWERVARRIGHLNAIRMAFVINIVSNLLMVFSTAYAAVVFSALTFGFAFMGIVSLVLTIVGKQYGYRSTQIMAQLTLGYCIAQILSPILAGTIAEHTGSFHISLYMVSIIMVLGFVCLTLMKNQESQ